MSEFDPITELKKKVVEFNDSQGSVGKEMTDDIEQRLEELKRRTEDFIKKNPLTSITIAFGIGYLIAKVFRRK